MERRVLVAIFLSFVVLYLYQALVVKPLPTPPAGQQATTTAPARPGEAPPAAAAKAEGQAATPAPAAAPEAAMLVGDTAEHDVTIETDDVIAVFTNRGARLKSWRL